MQRLQQALEAHERWRESGGERKESTEDFLARNEALRDLLEPMLADDAAEPDPGPARTEIGPGTTLGDFRIVRLLGKGGMGIVFEALQLSLGRRVALKLLTTELASETHALARFRREALAAAKLDHPSIVQVVAVGDAANQAYIAMELVDGSTLQELSRETSRLDAKRAAELALQIADALDHAHRNGIVHRDVKPANILLRQDGAAVLSDFGLARVGDLPGLTRTGSFAGTAYYMAPEQVRGLVDAIGPPTDIYALGVTLFECLAGRRPFEGTSTPEVFHAILHDAAPDLTEIDGELPRDLAAIVAKAIEKDPRDRYPTAAALAADLRAFLAYRPISARPPSGGQRLLRWARREPIKAALSALALLLLGALVTLGIYVAGTAAERRLGEAKQRDDQIELELADAGVRYVSDKHDPGLPAALARVLALDPGNGEALALSYLAKENQRDVPAIEALLATHAKEFGEQPALRRLRDAFLTTKAKATQGTSAVAAGMTATATPGETLGDDLDMIGLLVEGTRASNLAWATRAKADAVRAQHLLLQAVLHSRRPRLLFYALYGDAASLAGDLETTRQVARAMRQHWPNLLAARFYVGSMLRHVDPKAAVVAFRELLAQAPTHMSARRLLAYALSLTGDPAGALAEIQSALALTPKDGGLLTDASSYYMALGKYKECIKAAEQAIPAAPFLVEPHVNIASAYLRLGKLDKAEKHALEALALGPSYVGARTSLGVVRTYQKRFVEAERELRRALELNPEDVVALFNLGFALARQNRWEEGITELDKALTLQPSIHPHVMPLAQDYEAIPDPTPRAEAFFAKVRGMEQAASKPTIR